MKIKSHKNGKSHIQHQYIRLHSSAMELTRELFSGERGIVHYALLKIHRSTTIY
jgi:hypothetical protein